MKQNWIKQLNVGDTVIISGNYRKEIATIDRITPTGRIVIGTYTFNIDGSLRGADTWSSQSIIEATPERLQDIKEKNEIESCINILRSFKPTYKQAIEIMKIINKENAK